MVVLLFAKCGTQKVDGLAPVHGSLLTECACKNDPAVTGFNTSCWVRRQTDESSYL